MLRVYLRGSTKDGAEVRATVEGATPVEVLARVSLFVSLNPLVAWAVIE